LKYGKNSDIPEARKALEKTLALNSKNPFPYYIQTYFKLLVNQLGKDPAVTEEIVKAKYDELTAIIDKNIADPANKQLQAYKDVKSVVDDLYTQNFADKSDPADCAKLMEIYLKKYKEKPNDLETIKTVYAKTKGCADSATNVELLKKLNAMAPSYSYANRLGSIYMKADKFDSAYVLYDNALKVETDSSKKADMLYIMASIKANENDYPGSRELAKQAIALKPNMGKAYMLIGNLYLGSGKLCGPGTGFQSQIVLWPAFDYLKKAIEVGDDEVKQEAQKMISDYTRYLPTKADITAKKLSVGAPYTVKCWINEETTVKIK
jgi:tetratricopeptide (TPR) repeat protein